MLRLSFLPSSFHDETTLTQNNRHASLESVAWLDANLLEDHRSWAEAGEGRLQHVQTDEDGEPDKERVNINRQYNGEQDHESCKSKYGAIRDISTPHKLELANIHNK